MSTSTRYKTGQLDVSVDLIYCRMSETKPSSELLSAIVSADTKALKDVATVVKTNSIFLMQFYIIEL